LNWEKNEAMNPGKKLFGDGDWRMSGSSKGAPVLLEPEDSSELDPKSQTLVSQNCLG
jgi:hypothetical protein